jgi:hypothetical protein
MTVYQGSHGTFAVRKNELTDGSATFDVIWRASDAPFEYAMIFAALDETDAQMRCERLNAAIAEDWVDCDECGGSEKSGHMPSCSKHRNAALRK